MLRVVASLVGVALAATVGIGPASAAVAASPTQAALPLSAARYHAIQRILRASLPLDHTGSRAARQAYRKSCHALSSADPVLRAFRTWCLRGAAIYDAQAASAACRSVACYARALDAGATATRRFVTAFVALDRVLGRDVDNVACRRALGPPSGELARYRAIVRALRPYASALRSGNRASIDTTLKRLQAAERRRGSRSNRAELRDMQRACG